MGAKFLSVGGVVNTEKGKARVNSLMPGWN